MWVKSQLLLSEIVVLIRTLLVFSSLASSRRQETFEFAFQYQHHFPLKKQKKQKKHSFPSKLLRLQQYDCDSSAHVSTALSPTGWYLLTATLELVKDVSWDVRLHRLFDNKIKMEKNGKI